MANLYKNCARTTLMVRNVFNLKRGQIACKNEGKFRIDRGMNKVYDFIKTRDLVAIPFDQGCGFIVMKKSTNMET